MDSTRASLGGLVLDQVLGRGGMGEVWAARDPRTELDVAVKVITGQHARDPIYRTAFGNEVRAAARLDHPGIILLFDHGLITEDAPHAASLPAGSPYLVMERAESELARPEDWETARALLGDLLDALAHAHARGVVHRDIKPGNILVADGRPVITDFSIARPDDGRSLDALRFTGTPHYMAPEQALGLVRLQGPWTDLYSLGCLAWWLVTGGPPYAGAGVDELRVLHVGGVPPELANTYPVPGAFEGWVLRLMAKRPVDRFGSAAAAAWALSQLGPPDRPGVARVITPAPEVMGQVAETNGPDPDETGGDDTRALDTTGGSPVDLETLAPSSAVYPAVVPPRPEDWRGARQRPTTRALLGAGLGLYGLRSPPVVGRDAERDTLWEALGATITRRSPALVVVEGSTGVGKSRLVRWFVERARELGVASAVQVRHSPQPAAGDGLVPALARSMNAVGLSPTQLTGHLSRALVEVFGQPADDDVVAELRSLLLPDDGEEDDGPRVQFTRDAERQGAVLRQLGRLSLGRAVIVWLDDLQWATEAIDLLEQALADSDAGPLLFVATLRRENTTDELRGRVESLLDHPTSTHLVLPELPTHEQAILVKDLLHLEPELARTVVARTGGTPLFAVQLVGDWVARGLLEIGEAGFHLARGASLEVPDDLRTLWSQRVESLLSARPERGRADDREALELAAVLGQSVDGDEWASACAAAGVELSLDLVVSLLEAGLVEGRESSWQFTHGMLRETLVANLPPERRIRWHAACADALAVVGATDPGGLAERRAHHLLAAGDDRRAVDALWEAMQALHEREGVPHLMTLARLREAALARLGCAVNDERRLDGLLYRARIYVRRKRPAEAAPFLDELLTQTGEGWTRWSADATRLRCACNLMLGNVEAARADAAKAWEAHLSLGDHERLARVAIDLGNIAILTGDPTTAERHYRESVRLFEEQGLVQSNDYAGALRAVGSSLLHQGRYDEADPLLQKAAEIRKRNGARLGHGLILNELGEAARLAGRLEEAEGYYQEAETLLTSLGDRDAWLTRVNRALVMVDRGLRAEGAEIALECAKIFDLHGRRPFAGLARMVALPHLAETATADAFVEASETLGQLFRETSYWDRDAVRLARLSASLSDDPGVREAAEGLALEIETALEALARAAG